MLEDFHGTAEAIVFPDAWAKLNQTIVPDAALLLTGGYSDRDRGEDHAPFIVESARPLDELKASGAVALSLRWRAPVGAASPTRSRRRRPSVRLIRARRRSILSGATATGRRSGSGPAASASRRRRTSFGPCAISWAPIPSTTSRRDDPDGLSLHAGVREAAARAGAADRGAEAHRRASGRSTSTASSTALQGKLESLRAEIYRNLTPHAAGQVARHPRRPYTLDYLSTIFTDFIELHGDRLYLRRSRDRGRLGAARRRVGDGDRPPEGPRHQGEPASATSACRTPRATARRSG